MSLKPDPHSLGNVILAPISLGDLVDRITILKLKVQHFQGIKLQHARMELEALERVLADLNLNVTSSLIQSLQEINATLWKAEESIRAKERDKDFGDEFISLARLIYRENDNRAAAKRHINVAHGSALQEEKSY